VTATALLRFCYYLTSVRAIANHAVLYGIVNFFFQCYPDRRDLHSFPTRRSSDLLTGKLSTQADRAGIMGAILGTFWLMVVVGPVSMLFGVGTALYLELYMKKGKLQSIIQTNIMNLAGVPSIVYGILG